VGSVRQRIIVCLHGVRPQLVGGEQDDVVRGRILSGCAPRRDPPAPRDCHHHHGPRNLANSHLYHYILYSSLDSPAHPNLELFHPGRKFLRSSPATPHYGVTGHCGVSVAKSRVLCETNGLRDRPGMTTDLYILLPSPPESQLTVHSQQLTVKDPAQRQVASHEQLAAQRTLALLNFLPHHHPTRWDRPARRDHYRDQKRRERLRRVDGVRRFHVYRQVLAHLLHHNAR
jgi:hypothetical protein